MSRPVRPVGAHALLVECADLADVLGLRAALSDAPAPGQTEVLAGARTVLVRLARPRDPAAVAAYLADLPAAAPEPGERRTTTIDVVYDGADLADVAQLTGLSIDGVVAAHTGQEWTAAFGGFAPGFAYLAGTDDTLTVPRLLTPRTAVPAGAVALGGPFSAVYPRRSPGGWRLIGRTGARMWDLDREPPALLQPGDVVRFRAVRQVVDVAASSHAAPRATVTGAPTLSVVAPGPLALLEDLGRPGLLEAGVSPAGALDRGAARQANRLVGNHRSAAVVEALLGGLHVRADADVVLAVTGARAPLEVRGHERVVHRPVTDSPFALRAGEELVLGTPAAGLRAYLAVRGGVTVPPVLGSCATDTLAGLGPEPLRAGDVLPVGAPPPAAVGQAEPPRPLPGHDQAIRVRLGPRAHWLTDPAALFAAPWTVSELSNRVGLRLDGAPLTRAVTAELPSEGTVAGAIQVPPSGLPVVLLADHPVTGGYPVVAVVEDADLDLLAQVRPGERVRLVPV